MPWLRELAPDARLRVFCFPHAGGGTVEYRKWARRAPTHIDVCPVLLPGREGRLGETPVDRMSALIPLLVEGLQEGFQSGPFLLLGHSMGAWIAYELAASLAGQGGPMPEHLVVVGRRAPQLPAQLPPLSGLADPAFVAGVQDRYGAFPQQLLDQPSLLRLFLPALRADFSLLDSYRFPSHPPLDVPITAIGGTQDDTVQPADLNGWGEQTRHSFERIELDGGHFLPGEPSSLLFETLLDLAEYTLDHPQS
jgi:medium-chain acyl-[acyl-carrier-protein] hydrolase